MYILHLALKTLNQQNTNYPTQKYNNKLEYLAVYGRASMAAFRQLTTHGQKFDPESLYEPM